MGAPPLLEGSRPPAIRRPTVAPTPPNPPQRIPLHLIHSATALPQGGAHTSSRQQRKAMGKGKVHPSPSLPAAAAAGVGGGEVTAEAVLMRVLPAAVLAAAAPLGAEGKEVLAYLVLASLRSSRVGEGKAAEGGLRAAHRPELGCGCFGCYTAYWSRWNGSPEADREAIHRAIEAFEEHLANEEREAGGGGKGGGGGRRGRKKRAAKDAPPSKDAAAKEKPGKGKGKGKGKEVATEPLPLPPPPPLAPSSPAPEDAPKAEDGADYLTAEEEKEPEDAGTSASGGEEEKRRRGWGGVLSWRSWGLGSYSSADHSAQFRFRSFCVRLRVADSPRTRCLAVSLKEQGKVVWKMWPWTKAEMCPSSLPRSTIDAFLRIARQRLSTRILVVFSVGSESWLLVRDSVYVLGFLVLLDGRRGSIPFATRGGRKTEDGGAPTLQ
ncbi:hypothetical protein HU200_038505 [Digitaria exilis]|uniref:Uncharacterized protein n=1 Tax=Digitaria exilis TaxID=1010633 RepID=A0A835BNU5_9POAL|nr:hypothetical protein HU200_038505 [Digitaria exilis]